MVGAPSRGAPSNAEHAHADENDYDRHGAPRVTDDAAHLQQRVAVFAKLMFCAFLVLRIAEFVLYRAYLGIWPNHYWTIVAIGGVNLIVLASAWLVLTRRVLAPRALVALDLWLMSACGTMFGLTALLASNRPESAYTCLVYACFMVFTRTIVVPSSGRRTAVVSSIAMLPLVIGALCLAIIRKQDIPGPAFFTGGLMYSLVAVAVATTGSNVIYGLRQDVSRLAREGLELGKYGLVRKVGNGPLGEVFIARHLLLRRPTAVKLVAAGRGQTVLARCETAVQRMSQLRHYNTVAVYDYGRSPDNAFYVAMEYVEGIGLDVLLERYGTQPPGRVIEIVRQLCAALHEAHERGFAHGNLKGANVILCERGGLCDVVKLTDFGLGTTSATPADDLLALCTLATSMLGDSASTQSIVSCFAASSAKQLALALRALVDDSWSPTHAKAWWSEHHKTSAPFLQVPTTLAVDLARRAIS
jgi:eukaryotic-like serine/threonine-protein kinase